MEEKLEIWRVLFGNLMVEMEIGERSNGNFSVAGGDGNWRAFTLPFCVRLTHNVSGKICFCPLGFPKGNHPLLEDVFLGDVASLEEFVKDPWPFRPRQPATIQVKVPKLVVAPPPQAPVGDEGSGSGGDGEEVAAIAPAQNKHAALEKKAAATSMAVDNFARRFESGDVEGSMKDVGGEDQGLSNVKVMCRLCFSGENEGGERTRKMMSCKSCGKKCHLSCLKAWVSIEISSIGVNGHVPHAGFVSDEKYLQFQVDEKLLYACPSCRENSYQVINLEDAVQELWRRRDIADRDLIARLKEGAGLPVEEEIFSISLFSDDEDSAPVVKNQHSQSLKFAVKSLLDRSPQKGKEYGKRSGKKVGVNWTK